MLSRVADSLFWMSRYVERAENTARIVDVNLQLLLDAQKMDDAKLKAHWFPIVQGLGDEDDYKETYPSADSKSVIEYLTFQKRNPNSIVSCVNAARENARMVRDQLSTEMWEELNRLYLWINTPDARKLCDQSPYDFYREVKQSSFLFQGLTNSTIPHDEGREFILVGRYLERGDKTSRILDAKYYMLLPSVSDVGGAVDKVQWAAILSSSSATEAYRRSYVAEVEPRSVAELLILNEEFPRSIRFCMKMLDASLHEISGSELGHFSNEAEKLSGRLLSELNYSSIDDVIDQGLHEYCQQLQEKLVYIGSAVLERYIFYPVTDTSPEGRRQQQQQQQQ